MSIVGRGIGSGKQGEKGIFNKICPIQTNDDYVEYELRRQGV